MTRRLRRYIAVALAPLLLACGDDAGLTPIARQLAAAEARWEAQGLSHYTVESRIICFCPPVMAQWHELTVASDSVIAIRRLEFVGDIPLGEEADRRWFASVESMFVRMRSWPSSMRGNRLEATFDDQTGLPTRVNFITGPELADGGAVYEFRALKPGLTSARRF